MTAEVDKGREAVADRLRALPPDTTVTVTHGGIRSTWKRTRDSGRWAWRLVPGYASSWVLASAERIERLDDEGEVSA